MIRLARIFSIVVLVANSGLGQSANNGEIVPGNSLIADGIPKVPAALAQTVDRYTNAYGFRLAGWDLTKREVLLKNLCRHRNLGSPRRSTGRISRNFRMASNACLRCVLPTALDFA
jgi:hypothetical protein